MELVRFLLRVRAFPAQIKDDAAKSLKSSTAFFAKLQEEVTSQVSTVQGKNVRPKKNVKRLTGNKLKLWTSQTFF